MDWLALLDQIYLCDCSGDFSSDVIPVLLKVKTLTIHHVQVEIIPMGLLSSLSTCFPSLHTLNMHSNNLAGFTEPLLDYFAAAVQPQQQQQCAIFFVLYVGDQVGRSFGVGIFCFLVAVNALIMIVLKF
jgi:hypothetical protein